MMFYLFIGLGRYLVNWSDMIILSPKFFSFYLSNFLGQLAVRHKNEQAALTQNSRSR